MAHSLDPVTPEFSDDPMLNFLIEEQHHFLEFEGFKFVNHLDPDASFGRRELWAKVSRLGPLTLEIQYPRLREPSL